MSNKTTYEFEVETLKYGQSRPYAASEYEFVVKSNTDLRDINLGFCKALRLCSQTYEEWEKSKRDPRIYFGGYYRFEEIGERTYRYAVYVPYAD